MKLSENEKRDIIKSIEKDLDLPEKYKYLLFKNAPKVFGAPDILINAARQRSDVHHNMNMVQVERNQKQMEIAFRAQDNQVDKLIAAGKAQNQQAGRSGSKAEQAAGMAGGRKEAEYRAKATQIFQLSALSMNNLNEKLFYINEDAENKAEQVGKQYLNATKQADLDKWKIWETWDSAKMQNQINREDIALSKQQHDMNAWANNMLMPMRGPVPPPPFATPLPDLQDPLDHVWSPEPIEGAAQSGAVMGAIAGSLSGIGGALDKAFE